MDYVVFALRIALGGVLIVAGVLKAHDGAALTAASIAGYRILSPALVAPLAIMLPYGEIFLGGYVLCGLFTRIAATVASAQFLVFAVAVASLVVRGIAADCGCFGSGVATPPSWGHVALDVLLAGASALIAWRGPGPFALDRLLGASSTFAQRHEFERL